MGRRNCAWLRTRRKRRPPRSRKKTAKPRAGKPGGKAGRRQEESRCSSKSCSSTCCNGLRPVRQPLVPQPGVDLAGVQPPGAPRGRGRAYPAPGAGQVRCHSQRQSGRILHEADRRPQAAGRGRLAGPDRRWPNSPPADRRVQRRRPGPGGRKERLLRKFSRCWRPKGHPASTPTSDLTPKSAQPARALLCATSFPCLPPSPSTRPTRFPSSPTCPSTSW